MKSIYDLSEWDMTRLALLNQERDRLWKQIRNIEQEIHRIYVETPIKIKLDFNIPEDKRIIDELKTRVTWSEPVIDPKYYCTINFVGDDQ